jgi:nitroreductase
MRISVRKVRTWLGLPSALSLQVARRFDDDRRRFERSAFLPYQGIYRDYEYGNATQESLSAIIVMEYHRLEKAVSMPHRRANAASDVVDRLTEALDEHLHRFGQSETTTIAASALRAYQRENSLESLPPATEAVLWKLCPDGSSGAVVVSPECGGYQDIDAADLVRMARSGGTALLEHRHSIRDFSAQSVDRDLIRAIVATAMRAPSVCNRQEWRLYAIDDKPLILRCLRHQNGNRGFAERIPILFVVVVDLRRFVSVEERNQAWIDGGLFSMNVMLSLLAHGLGSCPLNWCAPRHDDDALRGILHIPDHEVVVMMIAAGYIGEHIRVAQSTRRPVADILVFRDS